MAAAHAYMESGRAALEAFKTDPKHAKTRQAYTDFERLRGQANSAWREVAYEEDLYMDKEQVEAYAPYKELAVGQSGEDLGLIYKESKGEKDEELLQLYVQKMLDGQPEEIKMQVLAEFRPETESFNETESKPEVVLSGTAKLGRFSVPIEVATNIYSHCDLESAVSLREVSRDFYSAYQASGSVIKTLLNVRSPWFYPDSMTWSDAGLVFVQRLFSPHWTEFTSINKLFERAALPEPPRHLAIELDHGDKMPECFKPLDEDWEEFPVNPKTLEPQNGVDLVKRTETETIVEYAVGKEVILPPKATFYYGSCVRYLKHYLEFSTQTHPNFLIPRDQPMHWKNADGHRRTGDYELGRFFYKCKEPEKQKLGDQKYYKMLRNPYTQEFIQYGDLGENHPIAVRNGLVWWAVRGHYSMAGHANMVPTFIDMESGKLYYRKDKVFQVSVDHGEKPKQCQNTRYMVKLNKMGGDKMGALIYDLDAGKSVLLQQPYKNLKKNKVVAQQYPDRMPTFWAGHVSGKFCAYFMDCATVKLYEAEEKKLNDIRWKIKQGEDGKK